MNALLALVIVGVVLALFPVDEQIKKLIYLILVVLVVVWLFGMVGGGGLRF